MIQYAVGCLLKDYLLYMKKYPLADTSKEYRPVGNSKSWCKK